MRILHDRKKYSGSFPELRTRADNPFKQVNIDSCSSSAVYIEGYSHTVVIVDCHSGYRWLNGMKAKDDMLKVIKKWYSDVADIPSSSET
jgi:hypothetical protein